ncbi:MAG: AMP-binding protein [Actinomycetota bacterium]
MASAPPTTWDPASHPVAAAGRQLRAQHLFSGRDIPWLLDDRAERHPGHPFLIWEPFEGEGRTWTYAAMRTEADEVAAGLADRGVVAGDRVLLHLHNCPELLISWLACARVGAIAVTTNTQSAGPEISYYAAKAGVRAAVTQPSLAAVVEANAGALDWLAVIDHDAGTSPTVAAPRGSITWGDLHGAAADAPRRAPDPLAPLSVQFTSGTTSRPKAVLWTHANGLWGAKVNADHEDLRSDDVHLAFLPLFHTNAQAYSVLATLWAGATVVLQPRFSASRFWDVSLRHGCTWCSMVPFMLRALAPRPVPEHTYRWWGNGVCSPPSDEHFGVTTMGWWGMTETITHGTVSDWRDPAPSMSMGRPAAEYGIAVVDDDDRPVAVGETGHLKVLGTPGLSLFAEYLGDPEATAAAFDDDGWFITGDRVTLGAGGWMYFADRDKDMLKVGGENVAASEVERVIGGVPGVVEAAVVARRHEMLDEVPVAFVLPGAGADTAGLADAVLDACRAQLASFKVPVDVRIVDELPRSTLEKIAKAELRRRLADEDQPRP